MRPSNNYFATARELTAKDYDQNQTANLIGRKAGVDLGTSCLIVLYYAPWCGHCKNLKPVIQDMMSDRDVNVFAFNIEKNSAHFQKIQRDVPNLVRGFPTIVFYKDGKPIGVYGGDRTKKGLKTSGQAACRGKR